MQTRMWRLLVGSVVLVFFCGIAGCQRGGVANAGDQPAAGPSPSQQASLKFEADRKAILGMAGTFKVEFSFEEALALRDGYALHDPYRTEAEELVVVASDTGRTISLQHLLVVRHGGEAHVIHHWRQEWRYLGKPGYTYDGAGAWHRSDHGLADAQRGDWLQAVYNVDESPRYSSWGSWSHEHGVSEWTGQSARRPLPLRESKLRDRYDYLESINTHVVTDHGWLHLQLNKKVDADHPDQPVLSLEQGTNRYERVPDKGFEKAHEQWKNTSAFWAEVRGVWQEVFMSNQTIRLRKKWKGDLMFSHLFGLADEYWGEPDVIEAKPRIKQVIEAFLDADRPGQADRADQP